MSLLRWLRRPKEPPCSILEEPDIVSSLIAYTDSARTLRAAERERKSATETLNTTVTVTRRTIERLVTQQRDRDGRR